MKLNTWTQVAIKIIGTFAILMAGSFFGESEYGRIFFNDWYCEIENHRHGDSNHFLPTWHWGWRHWLFCFMGVFLFVLQIVRIITFISKSEKEFYNEV